MKVGYSMCCVVALLATTPKAHAQPACGAPQGGIWPVGAPTGGSCVVQRTEAVLNQPGLRIVLPDAFTIVLAPDVEFIEWTADEFAFGQNVTLDLSAAQVASGKPGTPPSPGGPQPGYFQPGRTGMRGLAGESGRPGRTARIVVGTIAPTGNLWIRTDGGPGGPGGDGGPGGLAGGTRCQRPNLQGANGGVGGVGGLAGAGGATASVTIVDKSLPTGFVKRPVPGPASPVCGSSTRPTSATGDAGVVIWGHPGCGGAGGNGGQGGPPDCSVPRRGPCYKFPITNYFVHCGHKGPKGTDSAAGPRGELGVAVLQGPSERVER